MKVRTRLLLSGVLLPAFGLSVLALIAGHLFEVHLLSDLDSRLEAQAAVERESLFDGPDETPHLHFDDAPDELDDMVSSRAIYDAQGRLIVSDREMHLPRIAVPSGRGPWLGPPATPDGTAPPDEVSERQLLVVADDEGKRYHLLLTASLEPVYAAVAEFRQLTWLFTALVTLVLATAQTILALGLARRLEALVAFLPRLFTSPPTRIPVSDRRDEIGALQDALSDVSERLRTMHASRERFIAEAAHELRTPLTLLQTSIDLALRRERSLDEIKVTLEGARHDVGRLGALASRLLDLERLRHAPEAQRRPTDVTGLVGDLVARLDDERIVVELPPSLTWDIDPELLTQALTNLIENARKFAPESAVVIAHEPARDELRLTVSDDGPGVPEEQRAAIFEPFHRHGEGGQGTGLGLAIVAAIAKAHGGRCEVEPTHRGAAAKSPGACFRLVLPAATR